MWAYVPAASCKIGRLYSQWVKYFQGSSERITHFTDRSGSQASSLCPCFLSTAWKCWEDEVVEDLHAIFFV